MCACLICVPRKWSARSRRPQVLCWLYVNPMDFHPTFNQGKSEVLLVFQGKGSRQRKIRFFGPLSDGHLTVVGEMGIKRVRVVQQYTHLGCVIHHRADCRKEARRRIGVAQQTFNQHRRHLLQNPALTIQRRVELFNTLVLSRFQYGTESWTLEDNHSKNYVHNTLMRLFRRLLRRDQAAHLQDDDILVATGLNSPTELLRLARLRYLGTLHRCHELVPWGLLNRDQRWVALVRDDLVWTWQQLKDASSLPSPFELTTCGRTFGAPPVILEEIGEASRTTCTPTTGKSTSSPQFSPALC